MGDKLGFIFIVIIALVLGVYLYSSGALVNGVHGFNSIFNPSSTFSFFDFTSSSQVHGPAAPTGTWWAQGLPTTPTISGAYGTSTINPADIPAGFTAAELSPYFHDVRFVGASAPSFYYYGTITLSNENYYNSTGTIDVTGWQIKATAGDEYIPQAVNLYDPTGLTPPSDIMLKGGDTLSIYSTSAPFNLRLNECTGYVGHVASFNPPLPLNCPVPPQSQIQNFSGQCQNYIETIGGCQQPNLSGPFAPTGDSACVNYIENNFNYRSCFDAHDTDANFLSNQVWVWAGSSPLDPYHDHVELLDSNGLLVDTYSY